MVGFENNKINASHTAYGVICGGTTAPGEFQSISVGTSTHVLTSNGAGALPSMQASGGTGGNDWTSVTSGSLTGSAVAITSGLGTAYDEYLVLIIDSVNDTANVYFDLDISDDGGSTYAVDMSTVGGAAFGVAFENSAPIFFGGVQSDSGYGVSLTMRAALYLTGNKTSNFKSFQANCTGGGGGGGDMNWYYGIYKTNDDIDAMKFSYTSGDFSSGTYQIWGR